MKYNLNCHCGAVQLEVLTDLEIIKQCNCSICIRKNAKMCMVPKESINILKGKVKIFEPLNKRTIISVIKPVINISKYRLY